MKFVDEIRFKVASGHGGKGAVTFLREKFVPRGGPDGGDGGRGGSLIFEATTSRNTLVDYRYGKSYTAENGRAGGKRNMTGRSGADLTLLVPVGTVIHDAEHNEVLADLDTPGARWVLQGGRGGKGNTHFKSATNRTPRFAQDGEEGEAYEVRLELKLIADVGLLGFPNAGKSTLISRISAARPKVADYPFTTLVPNLGVVQVGFGDSFVVADIPGLIEGAAEGAGLGHTFLRHLERCKILVHLVPADIAVEEGAAHLLETLNNELSRYNEAMRHQQQIVCLSKIDCVDEETLVLLLEELREATEAEVLPLSSVRGDGVKTLIHRLNDAVMAAKG